MDKLFNKDQPEPEIPKGLDWYWYALIAIGGIILISGICGGIALYKKRKNKKENDIGNEGMIVPEYE